MYLIKTLIACTAAMSLVAGTAYAAKQPTKEEAAKTSKSAKKNTDSKSAGKSNAPLTVSVRPPSGQWEGTPPPADGWIWSAGYYEWKDDRFQWKPGEWILDKPGLDYRQHAWVQKGEDKWQLTGGDWVKETAGR